MGFKNIIILWVGGRGAQIKGQFCGAGSFHLYLGIKARLIDLDCQVPMACTYQVILPMCFWFYETKMNSLLEETGGYFLLHRDR